MKILFSDEEHSLVQRHKLFKIHASRTGYYYSKGLSNVKETPYVEKAIRSV